MPYHYEGQSRQLPQRSESRSEAKLNWQDKILFVFPIVLFGTLETAVSPVYWMFLPIMLFFGNRLRSQNGLLLITFNDIMILGLILSSLMSFALSDYKELSLVPTLYFIGFYAFLFALSGIINRRNEIGLLLIGSILGCLIVLLRFFFGGQMIAHRMISEAGGVLDQPNAAGSFAAVAVVSSLVFLRLMRLGIIEVPKSRIVAWSIWLTLAAGVLALLLSASRGSTAATAAFSVLWLLPAARRSSLLKQIGVVSLAAVIICVAWAKIVDLFIFKRFWYLAWEAGFAATAPEGRFDESIGIRDALKEIAIQIFHANPFFGSGAGTFGAFSNYVYTHTTIYEVLYAFGLAGTVPMFLLWGGVLINFIKRTIFGRVDREFFWLFIAVLAFLVIQGMSLPLVTSRVHMPLMAAVLAAARMEITKRHVARAAFRLAGRANPEYGL